MQKKEAQRPQQGRSSARAAVGLFPLPCWPSHTHSCLLVATVHRPPDSQFQQALWYPDHCLPAMATLKWAREEARDLCFPHKNQEPTPCFL